MKSILKTKVCKKCGTEKPLTEFHQRKDSKGATRAHCKSCMRKSHLDTYHNKGGKELQAKRSFKNNLKKYGITPEQYWNMYENQNGSCKICSQKDTHLTGRKYNLFVDHCHSSGIVRGLLCHHCNVGMGHFKDNIDLLEKAIKYLNENST